jgi:hypothetical protein
VPWEGAGAKVLIKDGLNFSIPAIFFFGWATILTN